jgi:hypothetical protein
MDSGTAVALTNEVWSAITPPQRPKGDSDDALDAIRGIIVGTLLSMLGFWLPLAIALAR